MQSRVALMQPHMVVATIENLVEVAQRAHAKEAEYYKQALAEVRRNQGTYQENHSMATVKNTCVSLKHYLLDMKEKKSMSDEADKVTADTVNHWMFSLRKAVATQRITVLEQNATDMDRNREAIATYEYSDFAQRATKYLEIYEESLPDRQAFTLVCDHLLVTILITNGQ